MFRPSGIKPKTPLFGWVSFGDYYQEQEMVGWRLTLEHNKPSSVVFHVKEEVKTLGVHAHLGQTDDFKDTTLIDGFKVLQQTTRTQHFFEYEGIGFMRPWLDLPFNRQYTKALPQQIMVDLANLVGFDFVDHRKNTKTRAKDVFFMGDVATALEQIKACWGAENQGIEFWFSAKKIILHDGCLNPQEPMEIAPELMLETFSGGFFIEQAPQLRPGLCIKINNQTHNINKLIFRKSNLPLEVQYGS